MKRLSALLLTFCILCTAVITSAENTAQYNTDDSVILSQLGILDISEAEALTRAVFVGYAVRALLPGMAVPSEKLPFEDLPLDSADYDSISLAYKAGAVKGSGTRFYPEEYISETEAITILLRLLGYGQVAEQGTGYPIGYLTCARTIGILGYKDTVGDTLSSQTAASLIKRALEAEMLEGKSYTNDSVKYSENGRTALFAKYGTPTRPVFWT